MSYVSRFVPCHVLVPEICLSADALRKEIILKHLEYFAPRKHSQLIRKVDLSIHVNVSQIHAGSLFLRVEWTGRLMLMLLFAQGQSFPCIVVIVSL